MINTNQFASLPNGIRIHYASCGDVNKPLLLCLHGFPEFWYSWKDLMPSLAENYFVVAPDMRGYNLSSKPDGVEFYKPKHLVQDLVQLVEYFGREKTTVIAHDWGGAIAWNFAIAHPQLVERLVILNSPHPYLFAQALSHDPAQQASSQYMNWLRVPGSENELSANHFEKLIGFFSRSKTPEWFNEETKREYVQAWSVPDALKSAVNWYRASPLYPPIDGDPGASKLTLSPGDFIVKVPTLVIWGMDDIALPALLLNGLIDFLPQGRIVEIPGASHWLVHEKLDIILAEIKKFI